MLLMLANEQREVSKMSEGNIAVLVGLKHVSLSTCDQELVSQHFSSLDGHWRYHSEICFCC